MAVLDGESLEHTFLVRLKPATVTFTFLVLPIMTSEWELLVAPTSVYCSKPLSTILQYYWHYLACLIILIRLCCLLDSDVSEVGVTQIHSALWVVMWRSGWGILDLKYVSHVIILVLCDVFRAGYSESLQPALNTSHSTKTITWETYFKANIPRPERHITTNNTEWIRVTPTSRTSESSKQCNQIRIFKHAR